MHAAGQMPAKGEEGRPQFCAHRQIACRRRGPLAQGRSAAALWAHGHERKTRFPSQSCPVKLSGAPATPRHAPSFWRVAWQRLTQEMSRSSRMAGRRREEPTRKSVSRDRHSVEAWRLSTCSGGGGGDEGGGEKARERGTNGRSERRQKENNGRRARIAWWRPERACIHTGVTTVQDHKYEASEDSLERSTAHTEALLLLATMTGD